MPRKANASHAGLDDTAPAPRVTTRDIADRLNIARSTVSTVLSGGNSNTRVSDELRARVLQTARQLGYRPNSAARAMASGRQGCAGLILSAAEPGRSTLPELVLRGLAEGLQANDMHLAVNVLSDETLTDQQTPRLLKEWIADGLFLNYNKHLPEGLTELVERYAIPIVWINRLAELNAVFPDDFGAGVKAGRQLLQRGHRRVSFVGLFREPKGQGHYSESARGDGVARALGVAGLTMTDLAPRPKHDDDPAVKLERIAALLAGRERPTAVVAYGQADVNLVAIAAARTGLGVPADLSVITFGGRPVVSGQPFATLVAPEFDLGRSAAEMLVHKIQARNGDAASVAVPFALDGGDTSLAAAPA